MLKNTRVLHEVKHKQISTVSISMDKRACLSSNISPQIIVYISSQQICMWINDGHYYVTCVANLRGSTGRRFALR
jgi:hypothetical protein